MVQKTAVVETIGPNGSAPKEGQIISNLDNSTNYVCSLIPNPFMYRMMIVHGGLTRELQAMFVGIVVGSRN